MLDIGEAGNERATVARHRHGCHVDIFYDDECGQVTGRGYSRVASEVLSKTWYEGKVDLGYPLVHLLVKAGQRQSPWIWRMARRGGHVCDVAGG